jgi:LPS-assembly lipoprotein
MLLVGCDFRLRGTHDTPTWLQAGVAILVEYNARDWVRLLRPTLEAANVRVTTDPQRAPYWLIIEREKLVQNITSVSSSTTPRQYQLTYTVYFRLETSSKKTVIKSSSVVVTRPLTINNDRVLGSRSEGEKLKLEMKRDAALKIIERLYQQGAPKFRGRRISS